MGIRKSTIDLNRQFLHASELSIRLPGEKKKTTFQAELPDELDEIS